MKNDHLDRILSAIEKSDLSLLSERQFSEKSLAYIARRLQENELRYIELFFNYLTNYQFSEAADWNIGSILQHFNPENIISELKRVPDKKRTYLYESIGLVWSLGELNTKSVYISDFLYEVLNYAKNSESWWLASFALEKVTGSSSINNLKRSLKRFPAMELDFALSNLSNKRNLISILLCANNADIKDKIYPSLKREFMSSSDKKIILNTLWLLAHLRLFDNDIIKRINEMLKESKDYEIINAIYVAISKEPKGVFEDVFLSGLDDANKTIRKMSLRGLTRINSRKNLDRIESLLDCEDNLGVIAEASIAISKIKNEHLRSERKILSKCRVNENGLIADNSDKWYADPSVYNIFSEAEDVENVCFDSVFRKIKKEGIKIVNPVDLATGTGKTFRKIMNTVSYSGTLYGVDYSPDMLGFLDRTINRQKSYINDIKLVQGAIKNFKLPDDEKSSFIISSFGFPSRISDDVTCKEELEAVYNNLSEDGIFVTIGWSERFNDELNRMWHKYIPDDIISDSFNEWASKRSESIKSPRNSHLSWYKNNIKVPLLFSNLEEAVHVMGHLFGRDAANEVLKKHQTCWWMSMGITWDTKESVLKALQKMR